MRYIPFYILLLLVPIKSWGQTLTVHSSSKKILIGEPITLTYKVKTKVNDSIFFQPAQSEISSKIVSSATLTKQGVPFEIIEPFSDTSLRNKTMKTWIGTYVVTIWDSGDFILPGPSISIEDSMFIFPEVTISAVLVQPKKGVDLYDIKENYADIPDEVFSFKAFLSKWWWVGLLLLLLISFYYFKNRKRAIVEENRHISLKHRTLIAIEALENEKLWEKNKLKTHYVELSYILRSYLTTRYSISLLERTTAQTKLLLREQGLNDDTIEIIIQLLSQSDMVKFAQSKPDLVSILKMSSLAKQIVAETSPLEIEDAE